MMCHVRRESESAWPESLNIFLQGSPVPGKEFLSFSTGWGNGQPPLFPSQMWTDAKWGWVGWQKLRVICLLSSHCPSRSKPVKGKRFPLQTDIKGSSEGLPDPGGCSHGILTKHTLPPCLSGVVVSLTQPHSWDLIKTQFPLLFNL